MGLKREKLASGKRDRRAAIGFDRSDFRAVAHRTAESALADERPGGNQEVRQKAQDGVRMLRPHFPVTSGRALFPVSDHAVRVLAADAGRNDKNAQSP